MLIASFTATTVDANCKESVVSMKWNPANIDSPGISFNQVTSHSHTFEVG